MARTWTEVASLPVSIFGAQGGVVDGKAYVCTHDNGVKDDDTFEYDPVTDTWTTKANRTTGAYDFSANAIGGLLYVAGGDNTTSDETLYDAETYAYDVGGDSWSTKASLPTGAGGGQLVVGSDGLLHLLGAVSQIGGVVHSRTHWAYDPGTDSWSTLAGFAFPINGREGCGAEIDGVIYWVVGENFGGDDNLFYGYDIATDTWTALANFPSDASRYSGAAAGADGKLYVVGGETSISIASGLTSIYDPATDTWEQVTGPPVNARRPAVVVIDDVIYQFGGWNLTLAADNDRCFKFAELVTTAFVPPLQVGHHGTHLPPGIAGPPLRAGPAAGGQFSPQVQRGHRY